MTVKSSGRKRKTPWSLWTERRVPSEYEAVTYKFHNHFRNEPAPFELSKDWPINKFYIQNRESSPLVAAVADWEGYRDPRAYTYRRYIEDQKDREVYLDNLIDEFEAKDHYRSLSGKYLDFLRDNYLPVRFPGHGMQMSAAYLGQMAPSAFVTNTFYFQMGNEMRRGQRQAYLAQVLAMDTERPDLADSNRTRKTWTEAAQWQGLRELIEKQLCAYDFGEALVSRQLVLRPLFDLAFNHEMARIANANDDELTAMIHDDFRRYDEAYAVETTKALVKFATENGEGNAALLKGHVEKWLPLATKAVEDLTGSLASAPNADSAEAIGKRMHAGFEALLSDCGL
jgi:toluene monooxygenase system protein E